MTMPADPPRPAHDEVVERLRRLSIALHNHTPASALRAAYHGLAPAERDWRCRDDLHDVLARLAQAERRAEEAERLAGGRLVERRAVVEAVIERAEQACRYVFKNQDFAFDDDDGKREGIYEVACATCEVAIRAHVERHLDDDLRRAAALTAAAEGTGGGGG